MQLNLALLAVMVFSLGCGDSSPPGLPDAADGGADVVGQPTDDKDDDGVTIAQGDCNDDDPEIRPGAREICGDSIDNNCNGAVDLNEPDLDLDGFGPCRGDCDDSTPAVGPLVDEIPDDGKDNNCDGITDADYDVDGQSEDQGDCDDDDPTVFQGAPEDCFDGKDNDCNGLVDDEELDQDGDGFGPCDGDCDDEDATINPDAKEIDGDGKDNNCDFLVDADIDGDLWTVDNGDCNDQDPLIHPGAAPDCTGGADLNCNGTPDQSESSDLDGDGVGACDGDCDDGDPFRAPGFLEFNGDKIDNDCDGDVDNLPVCDCAAGVIDEAAAMDLCAPAAGLTVTKGGDPLAIGISQAYGAISPQEGCSFFIISTGKAWDADPTQPGTAFGNFKSNPVATTGCLPCSIPGATTWEHPLPKGCCEDAIENDTAWVKVVATPPVNAKGFAFDFLFLSAEYPEFVHSNFNDTFYAVAKTTTLLEVQNVSFDPNGQPLTVNNSWFEKPQSATQPITNTGFSGVGSSSGWLTTTAPCAPGESLELTFWIHDEGDSIYDSAVIIDNFRWVSTTVGAPSTIK